MESLPDSTFIVASMETLMQDLWRGLRTHIFQPKYSNDPKYIRESTKEHLHQLSNQIVIVEDKCMSLLKDGYVPRKSTQWVKTATDLKCQVSDALNEKKNSPSKLQSLCDDIFDSMKDCPIEDVDDKPMAFIAPLHETEDRNLSESNLLPVENDVRAKDVEKEEASFDTCISVRSSSVRSSSCREGVYTVTTGSEGQTISFSDGAVLKLRCKVGENVEAKSSHTHDAAISQFPPTHSDSPHILEVQGESKEGNGLGATTAKRARKLAKLNKRRQDKMPFVECEVHSSDAIRVEQEMGFLTSEKISCSQVEFITRPRSRKKDDIRFTHVDESELGMLIPIPIISEMSVYADLRVEILTTLPSQASLDLNTYFGLSPTMDNYLFSAKKNPAELERDCELLILKEMLTADEWHRAGVVNLIQKNDILLIEKPDCPNLVLLFLQRNSRLTQIPPSFFNQMPALRFLDLSNTRIKTLPSSLFKLTNLHVLFLQNCVCLDSLPAELGNLINLEVLDLLGTDLSNLPKEIGKLTRLRHLQLSFYYQPGYGSRHAHSPSELISSGVILELQALQTLTIEVNPKDQQWIKIVGDIIQHVCKLKMLSHLQFYFPTVEALESFTESLLWKEQRLKRFKFIVGHNIKRIISRVPDEVEMIYEQHDCCVRFVNGDKVPEVMKSILKPVTAFYLDHHLEIQSLSEFDISNIKELKFCVVRECPNIQVMTIGEERTESVFPNLEYLGLHYLWKLERIWEEPVPPGSFQALKYLKVSTCGQLEYIASHSILQCLSNLETFIIEDCESLKSIVKENDMVKYDGRLLPQLSKLELRHLPQLEALGSGLFHLKDIVSIHFCPKLTLKPSQLKKLLRNIKATILPKLEF